MAQDKTRVVTTYLEMVEKPADIPSGNPEGALIMRANRPTVSFYRFLYNTVGENWKWVDRKKLSDDDLRIIIQDENVEVHVLYKNGVPAGYVELDFRQISEVEIAYFGLMPEFIGQGSGKRLLQWAINSAWERNPKRLWLHTCSLDHPGALQLYQKCGFKIYKSEEHEV
ncbi:GNAT family N-acetyltransferase [bacterium]|nr:GNAT family N-acetyltransferase [bacterium]